MLSFRNSCCKDCRERYVGCHSKCETYITERDKYEALKAKIKAEKDKEGLYYDYKQQLFRKMDRKGKK